MRAVAARWAMVSAAAGAARCWKVGAWSVSEPGLCRDGAALWRQTLRTATTLHSSWPLFDACFFAYGLDNVVCLKSVTKPGDWAGLQNFTVPSGSFTRHQGLIQPFQNSSIR